MDSYILVGLVSNLILYISVTKEKEKYLSLFYLLLIIKLISYIYISNKKEIDSDSFLIINFIFSLVFVQIIKNQKNSIRNV